MPEGVLPIVAHGRGEAVEARVSPGRRIGPAEGGGGVEIQGCGGVEVQDAAGGVGRKVEELGECDAGTVFGDAESCVDGAVDVEGEDCGGLWEWLIQG